MSKSLPKSLPPHILRRKDVRRSLRQARQALSEWIPTPDRVIGGLSIQDYEAEARAGWDCWFDLLTADTGTATGAGYTALLTLHSRLVEERERRWQLLEDLQSTEAGGAEKHRVSGFGRMPDKEQRRNFLKLRMEGARIALRGWALEGFLELYEHHGVYGSWDQLQAEHPALWSENIALSPEEQAEVEEEAALYIPRGRPRSPNVKLLHHQRTLQIALAFVELEKQDAKAAKFEGQNTVFKKWAAGIIEMSAASAEAALKGAGVINGEGKQGARGQGLSVRLLRLRKYAEDHEPGRVAGLADRGL